MNTLKADLRTILLQEKEHPLTQEIESLIEQSFNPNYIKPVKTWALIHDEKKRSKLIALLKGGMTIKKLPKLVTGVLEPQPEFVLTTATSVIDVNHCFPQISPRRKQMDVTRRSQIMEQGIFGNSSKYAGVQQPKSNIIEFQCRKLFNPLAMERILPTAELNIAFIREIANWCDTNANYYPYIDKAPDFESSPRGQAYLYKRILKEDHLMNNTYVQTNPNSPRLREPPSTSRSLMYSVYKDTFFPESTKGFKPSNPVIPPLGQCPFSRYPQVNAEEYVYTNEQVQEQCLSNRTARRAFRNVFNAKTHI